MGRVLCLSVALVLLPQLASAALITWGSATTISGDTDVSTSGTLVGAFNIGGTGVPSTTVNGVTFQSFVVGTTGGTAGNFALSGSGILINASDSTSPPFSNLSAAYKTLLATATNTSSPITLTISGLTVGDTYQFEFWSHASNPNYVGNRPVTANGDGGTVLVNSNASNAVGGLGQFAIGTFLANSSTQTISFSGPSGVPLDGFQLRDTTPISAPVPEPASLAIWGLSALSCAVVGYRRRRVA